jgi:type I site-specific restriction endonuclease
MGDLMGAEAIYKEIKAKDPNNAMVEFNLGILEHEHMAQNAMLGTTNAPEDPIEQMDWTVGNMKTALEHYRKALDHYRNFLGMESKSESAREDASKRIEQVQQIIDVTAEQIPQLEQQKEMLRQDLQDQADRQKAEAEAAKNAPPEGQPAEGQPADGAQPQ